MSRYFSPGEFERCSPACKIDDVDESFLVRLDVAREFAGVPFVLNSAFRTPEYEVSKGRSGFSAHCEGRAVDIRCLTDEQRAKIVAGLLAAGFDRIGIAPRFIHVDDSKSKRHPRIWLYSK